MPGKKPPALPKLLQSKMYKSGQTRGADDDEIYQNRVNRNGTALIRYDLWATVKTEIDNRDSFFENGYIVLLDPQEYFSLPNPDVLLNEEGLTLGVNALIFYQHRVDWDAHNPDDLGWTFATSRTAPLGGKYVARIHGTTSSEDGGKIARGFTTTKLKGAGIRLYEYAPKSRIDSCKVQLESIFWLCHNSIDAVCNFGMSEADAQTRKAHILEEAQEQGLLDYGKLLTARIVNSQHQAVCPLCLEPLDAYGFFNRKAQVPGREVFDLTITELNLFHIHELRPGEFNHKPYNLGWGHHLCNTVIGDEGIEHTLHWMQEVLDRNTQVYGGGF